MELGKRIIHSHVPLQKKHRVSSYPPQEWLDCPAYGELIIDCILPSKVPLGKTFDNSILPCKRYSFEQLMREQRDQGRILGLIIDLTNTNRYDSVWDLNQESIQYVKIPHKKHYSIPDNESVNLFVHEINQFLGQRKHCKKYVLVHCTHGYNRTGYMIVHYLTRTRQISVTQAIKMFAESRPPGIYKPEYIDSLYSFYNEIKPRTFVCPPTPDWKSSVRLDLDGDGGMGVAGRTTLPHGNQDSPMKLEDILRDDIPFDQEYILRQICYELLKLPGGEKWNVQFPGSHPVSLNRQNIELSRQQCYYATWKADGTRYMMLIASEGCFLIDRNFHFRRVQMRFPSRHGNEGLAKKGHHLTLLDGEMVIDRVPRSGQQVRRYLVYDMMAVNATSLVQRPFCERWKMIEEEVIEPRNYERQHIHESQNPRYRFDLEPFRVRRKNFWLLSTVPNLLKDFIPKLSHEADGLVFQAWFGHYVPRKHEGLLKWKYAETNSVDFLFEQVDDDHLLYLYNRGKKKLIEANRVLFQKGTNPSLYSGKIIECSWKAAKQMWVCIRIRLDKSSPNEFSTYMKVMTSINDNITEDLLVNEIGAIVSLPIYTQRTTIA